MRYTDYLRSCEREYFSALLAKHANNVTEAAREAGLNRTHLYKLMQRAGVKVERRQRHAGYDLWRALQ